MLRSEWQTAIDLVMAPFPDDSGRSDTGERQAREAWAATRDPDAALPHLPRWMGAERSLLQRANVLLDMEAHLNADNLAKPSLFPKWLIRRNPPPRPSGTRTRGNEVCSGAPLRAGFEAGASAPSVSKLKLKWLVEF